MPELTTWGTFLEWCRAFSIRPEWVVGWLLCTSLSPYPGRHYSSVDFKADDIDDDLAVQWLKVWHTRPEDLDGIPARPGKLYSYGMAGRDIYWLPGATRPKHGVYVSDEDDARFFNDLAAAVWHG